MALLAAAFALGAPARAQEPPGRPMAEALFREGRRLMDEGRYPEACPKLAESQRLEPGGGTLLNLALCHEFSGKTATAWVEFKDALAMARQAGRADREKIALQHGAELEPRLSHLTVSVGEARAVPGLEVRLDGVALGLAALGSAVPVDPGPHRLTASAPGRRPWERAVEVGLRGDAQEVTVPALASLTPSRGADPGALPPAADATPGAWRRPAGFAAGGAGLVALGVGAGFGARAIGLGSDSNARCPGGRCDAGGLELYQQGRSAAAVADVTLALGLVAAGAGLFLLLTAPRAAPPPAAGEPAAGVRAGLARAGGTLGLGGSF